MTVRSVLMMLVGWPVLFGVLLLVVAAFATSGCVLALVVGGVDRVAELLRWPAAVPGWS